MPLSNIITRILALTTVPTLTGSSLTEHPTNECFDHEFLGFNASFSVSIPPLLPNLTNSTLATWKLGTVVKETIDHASNNVTVKQKFWLEGDSNLPGNATRLPFDGCIIHLSAQPDMAFRGKGANHTLSQNGCSKAMSLECQDAILSWMARNISSYENRDLDNHWTICPKIAHLLVHPPKECSGVDTFDTTSLQPFGNPEFIPVAENGCNSTDFDVFEGSAIRNSFLQITSPPQSNGHHSYYDQVVETTTPVILAAWPRNRTKGWLPDLQMACLTPADNISNGSRVPGNDDKTDEKRGGAATRWVQGESHFALWMLLLLLVVMV